jgi:hypothetical protein
MGIRRKPVADRYRIGTNSIDTDSIALIVKKMGRTGRTRRRHFRRAQLAARGDLEAGPRRASTSPVSSSSPALKSLEESVELDELQPHHPLKDVL